MLLATGVVHFSFGPRGSTVLGRQRYSHALFFGFFAERSPEYRCLPNTVDPRYSHALFFGFFAERSPAAAHSHFVLPLRAVASHRAPPDGSPTIGRGFLSAPAHSTHAHSADAVPTDARRAARQPAKLAASSLLPGPLYLGDFHLYSTHTGDQNVAPSIDSSF